MQPYKGESSDHKTNAQRNLMGRTHYVDDDTLRWHKSRVLSTHIIDGGFLFALVESCAADMDNRRRVFRPVIFDVFGTVIDRPKLKEAFSTRRAAERAMLDALNTIDAKEVTLKGIANAEKWHALDMTGLREKLDKLSDKAA